MRLRVFAIGIALAVCACGEDDPSRAQAAAPPLDTAAPEVAPPQPPELPTLCLLAGADEAQREDSFTRIVFDYFVQTNECETSRLSGALGELQVGDWLQYLLNYSHALFGCGLLFEPLPGGVNAFGLANIEAVGAANPRLTPEDAGLLIDIYLSSCTSVLPVPNVELAQLRMHLEAAAQAQIDRTSAVRLSECQ